MQKRRLCGGSHNRFRARNACGGSGRSGATGTRAADDGVKGDDRQQLHGLLSKGPMSVVGPATFVRARRKGVHSGAFQVMNFADDGSRLRRSLVGASCWRLIHRARPSRARDLSDCTVRRKSAPGIDRPYIKILGAGSRAMRGYARREPKRWIGATISRLPRLPVGLLPLRLRPSDRVSSEQAYGPSSQQTSSGQHRLVCGPSQWRILRPNAPL